MRLRDKIRHLWSATAAGLCLFAGGAPAAHAHDLQLSGISIRLQSDAVIVNATTPLSRLAQAEHSPVAKLTQAALDLAVRRRLHLRLNGRAFAPGAAHIIRDATNDLLVWQARLPLHVKQLAVLAPLYPQDAAARTVVVVLRDGQSKCVSVLNVGHPQFRAESLDT